MGNLRDKREVYCVGNVMDNHVNASPWAVTRQLGYNILEESRVVVWNQPRVPVPAASIP